MMKTWYPRVPRKPANVVGCIRSAGNEARESNALLVRKIKQRTKVLYLDRHEREILKLSHTTRRLGMITSGSRRCHHNVGRAVNV